MTMAFQIMFIRDIIDKAIDHFSGHLVAPDPEFGGMNKLHCFICYMSLLGTAYQGYIMAILF